MEAQLKQKQEELQSSKASQREDRSQTNARKTISDLKRLFPGNLPLPLTWGGGGGLPASLACLLCLSCMGWQLMADRSPASDGVNVHFLTSVWQGQEDRGRGGGAGGGRHMTVSAVTRYKGSRTQTSSSALFGKLSPGSARFVYTIHRAILPCMH